MNSSVLDASIEPREAFFLLGKFAISEFVRAWDIGLPQKDGIARRFAEFLQENVHEAGADLLWRSLAYSRDDPDAFAYELTASLSCPQQAQMALFELEALLTSR